MKLIKAFIAFSLVLLFVVSLSCKTAEYEGGRLSLKEGNYEKAIKQFKSALEKEPENGRIYMDLAAAYAFTNQWDEAAEAMENAEKYITEEDADIEQAREELWYKLSNDLAIPAFNEGDYETAIKYFEVATKIKPDSAETWDILGSCYAVLGETEKAIEALEIAYELSPGSADIVHNLAKAYLDIGDFEKANEMLYELEVLEPDNPEIIYLIARIEHDRKNYDLAIEKYRKVLELDDEHLDAMYYQAQLLYDIKEDYEGAKELLESYTTLYEDDAVAWARLAMIYKNLGEKEKALDAAKKAEQIQNKQKSEDETETPPPPPE
jgi:Flp pilus assembly protein TadD